MYREEIEHTYTAEIIEPFKIAHRREINFGGFYFSRLMWNLSARGGAAWQQGLFTGFQFIFFLLTALPLDVAFGIAWLILLLLKEILLILKTLFIELMKVIFKTFVGTSLKWLSVIAVLFGAWIIYDTDTWQSIYIWFSGLLQ